MKKSKIKIGKNLLIFILTGIIYVFIEVCVTAVNGQMIKRFDAKDFELLYWGMIGYSSIYMFFIGGLLGVVLGNIDEIPFVRNKINLFFLSLMGSLIITGFELVFGVILNIWCGFHIWDYNGRFLNFMGQICIFKSLTWFFLSPLIFWFDDLIRALLYNEGKQYSLMKYYVYIFIPWGPSIQKIIDRITA